MENNENVFASRRKDNILEFIRRFSMNKLAVVGIIVIIAIILIAILAPVIAPYDYAIQDYNATLVSPNSTHLLGTDNLGRDVLSRLIFGAQTSLFIAFFSTILAAAIGITLGSIAGYYGGAIDNVLMRFLDIYQSIPVIILSIALATALGPGTINTVLALAITVCPLFARMMRASIMTVRKNEYIEAAHAVNASHFKIIMRHIIPNAFSPLIINITMSFGSSMLVAATLSFIGLGAQPPSPEWGAMLNIAKDYISDYPYLITFPGLCIMISVLSFNLIGDGLRDALDPRMKN